MKKALTILIILSLPFLLILDNTKQIIFDEKYHENLFEKLSIYKEVPNAKAEDENVVSFLKGNPEQINGYDSKEQSHMQDVRTLVQKGTTIYYIIIILLLAGIIFLSTKEISNALMIGSIITLTIIGTIALLNFNSFFDNFHKLFFTSGTWQFSEGIMVQMYSQEFFQECLKKIMTITAIQSAIILAISSCTIFIIKRTENKKRHAKNK